MLTQVIFFLVISSGGVLAFMISKEVRPAEYYPITCMAITMILFLFGICNLLLIGFSFLCVAVVLIYILFAVFLILQIRKGNQSIIGTIVLIAKKFFTPGAIFFIAVFIWLTWRNSGRVAFEVDEFSHWATVVKQMFMTNTLSTNPQSIFVSFKSYPPAMSLFQYFLIKLYGIINSGQFCEWRLYFAYQIFAVSLLIPFVERLNFNKARSYILLLIVLHMPLVFFNRAYDNLQVDSFLGCLAGISTAAIFTTKQKSISHYLFVVLSIPVLVLTKDVGMFFAIFAAVIFVVSLFIEESTFKAKRILIPITNSGISNA